MKTFRIIMLILLVIPLYLLVDIKPTDPNPLWDDTREWYYLICGVPVIMMNYAIWFTPHIIDEFIAGYKKDFPPKSDKNTLYRCLC